MNSNKQVDLLDNLQNLLQKQIEMVRSSDLRAVETIAQQAESIVDEMIKTEELRLPEFSERRKQITELYEQLELMLSAAKDSTGKQLRQINDGLRTLHAYSDAR